MVQTLDLNLDAEDRISWLPDDILLTILSELDLKQQARTSILSTRWTNLWTLNTTSLSIDTSYVIPNADLVRDRKHNTLKFVNTVDQILRKHRGQTLDELNITYPKWPSETRGSLRKEVAWIKLAIKKQVKALYLNLNTHWGNHSDPLHSLGSAPFSSLVTLRLIHAALPSDTIHCLLSNAPNLLELSIRRDSSFLKNLKISGSSLKLKHLELIGNYMDFVEICAPNLVSFSFSNQDSKYIRLATVCFKSTPLLTQLSYERGLTLRTLSDCYILFPQLESVNLTIFSSDKLLDRNAIPHLPSLINLKQMQVKLNTYMDEGLRFFLGLFKASPSLRRLSLDIGDITWTALKRNLTDHKYLKEIEIDNFSGYKPERQLLICIAKSASSLKKIIIRPGIYKKTDPSLETFVEKLPSRLPQKELEILLEPRNAL